ncbi:MAG: hypothetical protein ACE5JA_05255 [bacterium]
MRVTQEQLRRQEEEFFQIANGVLKEAKRRGVTLRLLGAIAFRSHCPKYKFMQYSLGRALTDIDFAAYSREASKVQRLFLDIGCSENQMVMRLFGRERRIFYYPDCGIHSDVFFDNLKFCHDINLSKRLNIDYPTIPVADLLLEKLQIVEINEKDLIDSTMLLCEHLVADTDDDSINAVHVSDLCSRDWGLWRTVTGNLDRLESFLPRFIQEDSDKGRALAGINSLRQAIASKEKSFTWRMRARVGERKKWYREVEEVER